MKDPKTPHHNGDYHPDYQQFVVPIIQQQNHDKLVARVQYFSDYLKHQYNQFIGADDTPDCIITQEVIDRIISVHEELFSDFIYSENEE